MIFRINPTYCTHRVVQNGTYLAGITVDSSGDIIIPTDERIFRAIEVLGGRFRSDEAISRLLLVPSISHDADALWNYLVEEALVVQDIPSGDGHWIALHDHWRNLGWDVAARYHFSTRDHPFLDMTSKGSFEKDNSIMREYAEESPPPSIFQDLGRRERIPLEKIENFVEPADQILDENTPRPTLRDLTMWLDLAFGARQHLMTEASPEDNFVRFEMVKKAVPSGGSRHPLEAFLKSTNFEPIQDGLYHYNVKDHSLANLEVDNLEMIFGSYEEQRIFDSSIFTIFITVMLERAMWRYRDSRSWRAVAFDTGHAIGMLEKAVATSGFESTLLWTFDRTKFQLGTGLDPDYQPLYAIVAIGGDRHGR